MRYGRHAIYGALRDLVPCAQFKEREKHPFRSVTFSKVAGLLAKLQVEARNFTKSTLLRGCFSRFLNCRNGTKSRKAPHISKTIHF